MSTVMRRFTINHLSPYKIPIDLWITVVKNCPQELAQSQWRSKKVLMPPSHQVTVTLVKALDLFEDSQEQDLQYTCDVITLGPSSNLPGLWVSGPSLRTSWGTIISILEWLKKALFSKIWCLLLVCFDYMDQEALKYCPCISVQRLYNQLAKVSYESRIFTVPSSLLPVWNHAVLDTVSCLPSCHSLLLPC